MSLLPQFDSSSALYNMSQEPDGRIKCLMYSWAIMLTILLLAMLSFPAVEIVYGSHYDIIGCRHQPIITISTWLIVDGCSSFVAFIVALLSICLDVFKHAFNKAFLIVSQSVLLFCIIICCTFSTVWLILGAISFWRDCVNIVPTTVNTFMWAALIIKLVLIYLTASSNNRNNN